MNAKNSRNLLKQRDLEDSSGSESRKIPVLPIVGYMDDNYAAYAVITDRVKIWEETNKETLNLSIMSPLTGDSRVQGKCRDAKIKKKNKNTETTLHLTNLRAVHGESSENEESDVFVSVCSLGNSKREPTTFIRRHAPLTTTLHPQKKERVFTAGGRKRGRGPGIRKSSPESPIISRKISAILANVRSLVVRKGVPDYVSLHKGKLRGLYYSSTYANFKETATKYQEILLMLSIYEATFATQGLILFTLSKVAKVNKKSKLIRKDFDKQESSPTLDELTIFPTGQFQDDKGAMGV
ncbi:hypothetical protein WN51_05714 [Melipona quadrifasciata]|uniref:Uncharacterized protein n=1 Tax=Melipona quadrifasciata TaxID=166423 RepID=A0A0N0U6G4_9HYME|nr:hypothetical protein WN51_05714 [Melipona quadrifasciata]